MAVRLVLPPQLNPYEEWFLGWGTAIGVCYLAGVAPYPAAITRLPGAVASVWAFALLASGVVGWVGCRLVRRDPQLGLRLEEAGLLFAAGAFALYLAAALAVVSGPLALVSAAFMAALLCAHVVRIVQIERQLREMRPE